MLSLSERTRPPRGVPSARVLWPITVYRVEVVGRREGGSLDPFAMLVLDAAAAGERDPHRIAELVGLPKPFVRALIAAQFSQGTLDEAGRLTEAGRSHRVGVSPVLAHLGTMFRCDITGEPLPVFLDEPVRTQAPLEDAPPLPAARREQERALSISRQARFIEAFYADGRLRRATRYDTAAAGDGWAEDGRQPARGESVRLLDSGTWQEVLVEVWADVDPQAYEDGYVLRVQCPFGRPALGMTWLRRLRGTVAGQSVIRDVELAAREALQRANSELADAAFQGQIEDEMERLTAGRATLPEPVRKALRLAEVGYARCSRETEDPDSALVRYGTLAEEVLFALNLPRSREPTEAQIAEVTAAWPADERTRGRLVRSAIEGLVEPDDDGRGLEVPGHLRVECERFGAHLCKHGRLPSRRRVGVTRQLRPFASAALFRDTDQSRLVVRALGRDSGLWGHLCRAIDYRNPAAHGDGGTGLSAVERRERLAIARRSIHAAIDAAFPRVEDGSPNSAD